MPLLDFYIGLERSGIVIMVGTVGLGGMVCIGRTDIGFWLDILFVLHVLHVLVFCNLLMFRMSSLEYPSVDLLQTTLKFNIEMLT